MKKIMHSIFVVSLLFISILNFFDYSNNNNNKFKNDKESIQISKKEGQKSKDFVYDIQRIVKELNTDIMMVNTELTKEDKVNYVYYITCNSGDFLDVGIDNYVEVLKGNGELKTSGENRIPGSTFTGHTTIYPFEDVSKYNLENSKYFVKSEKVDEVLNAINKEGYLVSKDNGVSIQREFLNIKNIIIPLFLLTISMIFYSLGKGKETVLRKISGFSNLDILKEYLKKEGEIFIVSFVFISLLNMVFIAALYRNSLLDFLNFSMFKFILFFAASIFIFILANTNILFQKESSVIKGKKKNRDIYVVTLISKFIFITLLLTNLTAIISGILEISKTNKILEDVNLKAKNYVVLPFMSNITDVSDNNQLEYNKRLSKFYEETKDKFNGILIDSRNLSNPEKLERNKKTFQNYIMINENYLKENEVRDSKGDRIEAEKIDKNKLNLFVTEGMDKEAIKENYKNIYDLKDEDIVISIYDKNTKLFSYSAKVSPDSFGFIEEPIIILYNGDIFWDQMMNFISGGYYILDTKTDNPYEEIKPYLEKYKLTDVLPEAQYVSNTFSEVIESKRLSLLSKAVDLFVYIVGALALVIYSTRIYFTINKKEIIYKTLGGYKFIDVYKGAIITQIIEFILLLICSFILNINLVILFIVVIVEIIIFKIYASILRNKNVVGVIKGEE